MRATAVIHDNEAETSVGAEGTMIVDTLGKLQANILRAFDKGPDSMVDWSKIEITVERQ